jgi:tripartite ATP-independent transporter DctM subunit
LAELFKRGYNKDIAVGSLAGAGSLGLLIPPSILMIVYGILAEVSIVKLFSAGLIPGLMMAGLYSSYLIFATWRNPSLCPQDGTDIEPITARALAGLLPTACLIFVVLGSLYSGIATPSEAAAVGVLATLVLLAAERQLTFRLIGDCLMSTVTMSAMVVTLVVAAATLSNVMGFLHVPQDLARFISALDLSPHSLIMTLAAFFIVLGFFLEGVAITVMTLPIVLPLIKQAGFDPIWFGVFLVVMVEMATITPPVGFNLFVIQSLTNFQLGRVALAAFPFFLLMCLGVILMYIFPQIVLWLPSIL